MISRSRLGPRAARAALRIRQRAGYRLSDPVSAFDLAEKLGLEVRFVEIGTLEGMYCRLDPPLILLSSLRPPGRQAFTCAHELGHHVFGHGTRLDEIVEGFARSRLPREERLVSLFAGFLLMPKGLVRRAFRERGLALSQLKPEGVYVVARWLGVGYETVIDHMHFTLGMLTASARKALLNTSPKQIRGALAKRSVDRDLIVVDGSWGKRSVDVQVGDYIVFPADSVAEEGLKFVSADRHILIARATRPGRYLVSATQSGLEVYVRVSRRNYVGRNLYRYLEDADND